jgi:uncharacterized protein (DUF2384 family)
MITTVIETDLKLIERSREGIDKKFLTDILGTFVKLTLKEFAGYLQVSPRMIQKKSQTDKFSIHVSEHALYISRLYIEGSNLFGSSEKFNNWMDTANPSMDGTIPKSYLDTISGIKLISNIINGMAHGFSA